MVDETRDPRVTSSAYMVMVFFFDKIFGNEDAKVESVYLSDFILIAR